MYGQVAINPREQDSYHVVGFIVEPFSFKHSANEEACMNGLTKESASAHMQAIDGPVSVKFTYDVVWEDTGQSP